MVSNTGRLDSNKDKHTAEWISNCLTSGAAPRPRDLQALLEHERFESSDILFKPTRQSKLDLLF